MPGEEVVMTARERGEQIRAKEPGDAVDHRELARARLAHELSVDELRALAPERDGTERSPAMRADDEVEETLPHAATKSDGRRE